MSARVMGIAGLIVLAFAWGGPLPTLVSVSFSAHMTLHMLVVGIAAPLLAAGLAPYLSGMRWPLGLAVAASLMDFVVVWLLHVPAFHHASRTMPAMLALEQASFFGVALLVWLVALAGSALAGALTLFLTSMHMTLLGTLLGLAPRLIYPGHGQAGWLEVSPLQDQQAGGVVMLAIGGIIYLAGALWVASRALRASDP